MITACARAPATGAPTTASTTMRKQPVVDRILTLPCLVAAVASVATLAGAPARARAAGAWLDGEIRALALAGDRLVALRDGEAWLLTASGRVLGPLGAPKPAPAAPAGARPRGGLSGDETVDLLGIVDDDPESDLVRDALDDEGVRPARRRRDRAALVDDAGNAASQEPSLIAAGGDAIWIGD